MSARCAICEMKKNHRVHVRAVAGPQYHAYQDASKPGLKPMSEGMRNFRRESGYDAAAKSAKGQPCQSLSRVDTGRADHLHEPLSRGRAGGLEAALRDGPAPFSACDACNSYVSEHPVWAREKGLLVSLKGQDREGSQDEQ